MRLCDELNFTIHDLLQRKDMVLELWWTEDKTFAALLSAGHDPPKNATVGHGKTILSAIMDAREIYLKEKEAS